MCVYGLLYLLLVEHVNTYLFSGGIIVLFIPRVTFLTMIRSTSTMLRQKQHWATTKKQKRYFASSYIYTTAIYRLRSILMTIVLDSFEYFFQVFLLIQNEKIKNDYVYLSWLARCCMYTSPTADTILISNHLSARQIPVAQT